MTTFAIAFEDAVINKYVECLQKSILDNLKSNIVLFI